MSVTSFFPSGPDEPTKPLQAKQVQGPTVDEVADAIDAGEFPSFRLVLSRPLTRFEQDELDANTKTGLRSSHSGRHLLLTVSAEELAEHPEGPNKLLQNLEAAGALRQKNAEALAREMAATAEHINGYLT